MMELSEAYAHAYNHILMMNSLPSVEKAYATIMTDESQRVTSDPTLDDIGWI